MAAYTTKEQAELHKQCVERGELERRSIFRDDDDLSIYSVPLPDKFRNGYDLDTIEGGTYNDITYFIEEAPLVRHLDEWLEEVVHNPNPDSKP